LEGNEIAEEKCWSGKQVMSGKFHVVLEQAGKEKKIFF
jgi:hypothetical protein